MESLEKAKRGIYYNLVGISDIAPLKLRRRLLELGLTAGQKVRIVRKSLLGKAYLLEVRGYTLSMRKNLVAFLMVAR